MRFFATAQAPKPPKTEMSRQIALVYAGILAVLALSQLFSLEETLALVQSYGVISDGRVASGLVLSSIVAEVFAIPFLLRMHLSSAMRWLSMLLGWFVAVFWLVCSVLFAVAGDASLHSWLFGTVLMVPSGWWAVYVSMGLCVLAGWSSWGLFPTGKSSKDKKRIVTKPPKAVL